MTSERKNTYNFKTKQKITEQADRLTKVLLFILALFIMSEAPHGVFLLLAAYYGPKFYWMYYYYAMEVFNTLTHISESFNFVIYYSLSSQFRATFKALFNRNNEEVSNSKTSTQTSPSSVPEMRKLCDNSNQFTSISAISSTTTHSVIKIMVHNELAQ